MSDKRQRIGRHGEDIAATHLAANGYRILERNYRCSVGEMDIIAQEGDCLAFIEVRTRTGANFGTPEESVTPVKQRKLVEVALSYLQEKNLGEVNWRIDVVAIELGRDGRIRRLNLVPHAVSGDLQ